jgi:hypothetical protein
MSIQTATNRFIVSPLHSVRAGLYQHIFRPAVSFHELGNGLIRYVEHAQAIRQVEHVQEAGQLLANLPLKEYQAIGQYYLAWCDYRNNVDARETLEHIAEHGPVIYRARALQSLAAIGALKQDYTSELSWLVESLKIYPSVEALRGIAIVKAKEGFNSTALKDLESLLPLARTSQPVVFYSWLNSLATELGEAGRKDEARNISRIVLASSFAPAYPEWQETAQDLKEPSRSFVSVPSIEPEPVEIETIEAHHASEPEQPATILSFPKLKEAPQPQKPERLSPQEVADLTLNDMRELILAAIKTGAIQESQYIKMMNMVGLLKNGLADKILDLEDEETLSDIAVAWAHQVEPEELAAVLSAIRDCEDRMRQRDILDRFIRIVFEETQECGLNEEAWRLRVERRLPKKWP